MYRSVRRRRKGEIERVGEVRGKDSGITRRTQERINERK